MMSFLRRLLHIQGDSEPSLVVLGEQVTMEKTTRRFHAIASTLAELNAERLSAQTVNDPHYVRWRSQPTCVAHELCSRTRSQNIRHRGHSFLIATHRT